MIPGFNGSFPRRFVVVFSLQRGCIPPPPPIDQNINKYWHAYYIKLVIESQSWSQVIYFNFLCQLILKIRELKKI